MQRNEHCRRAQGDAHISPPGKQEECGDRTMDDRYRIVLASASPRRRELLSQIGLTFTVYPSRGEEHAGAAAPDALVLELAAQKAAEVYGRLTAGKDLWTAVGNGAAARSEEAAAGDAAVGDGTPVRPEDLPAERLLVIGADTVVACGGRILGKPAGREDACRMLGELQGKSHFVYTGVTVIRSGRRAERFSFYERTRVDFYPMTPEEIAAYVGTGEPMDKAGAYGIQGRGAAFIKGIEGDYNNVVGLPVGRLYQEMRQRNWL